MKIGAQIRNARKKKGLSQEALALEIGLDQSHLSQIELDQATTQYETLARLCEFLGMKPPRRPA